MFAEWLAENSLSEALKLPWVCPFPKAGAWQEIGTEDRLALLEAVDAMRETPYPLLRATDFMAYARTGDRQAWEKPYFLRRRKLILAALACCLRGEAQDADDVVDGLWCICEESSWVISAHNNDAHEGTPTAVEKPLPDTRSPVIDLFAAQTGMILALVLHLTGEILDGVTPLVRQRVEREIENRLLTPFETRDDFWWMGFLRKDLCNWTPWILSNLLLVSALQVSDKRRLTLLFSRGLRMTDRWLDTVPEDGGCDEGVAYWNMAGGAFLDILELTSSLTGGKLECYSHPKVRRILCFPYRMWLGGDWFANFADCDARPYVCGERLMTAGRAVGDPGMVAFGASRLGDIRRDLSDTPQLWRLLNRLFVKKETAGSVQAPAGDLILPDLQVRAFRRGGLTMFIKGGHNGENHNHNDVGSWILFCDADPVCIDIGNIVYTAKTFSDRRYEIFNTRSRNHSVPMIGDFEQAPGAEHRGSMKETENGCSIEMSAAYPREAGVRRLTRTLTCGEKGFLLEDRVELQTALPVTEVIMLRKKPEKRSETAYDLGGVVLHVTGAVREEISELPVMDPRLSKSYPGSLWRLALFFASSTDFSIRFQIDRQQTVL